MKYYYIRESDVERLQEYSFPYNSKNIEAFKRRIEHYPYIKLYVYEEEQTQNDLVLIDEFTAELLTMVQWYHLGKNVNIDSNNIL